MFTTLLPKTNEAAEAETFVDRAHALVAFLVERHGRGDAMRAREQDLADWIASRRESGSAAHFVATELGIILRALSGPTGIGPRAQEMDHQQLCWLIARRMSHDKPT